jgi:hypothetical protein
LRLDSHRLRHGGRHHRKPATLKIQEGDQLVFSSTRSSFRPMKT